MPTYKVGFPFTLVDAPDERAARIHYFNNNRSWCGVSDVTSEEVTGAVAEYVVDAEGEEIEEDQTPPPLHGCTPSEKHPGLCAECGEPLVFGIDLPVQFPELST